MSSDIPINQNTNITDTIIQGYCKNKCKLRYNYPDVNTACVMRITPDSQLDMLTINSGLNYPEINALTSGSDLMAWTTTIVGKDRMNKIQIWLEKQSIKHSDNIPKNTQILELLGKYYDKEEKMLDHNGKLVTINEYLRFFATKQIELERGKNKQNINTEPNKQSTNTYLSITIEDSKPHPSVSFNSLGYNESEIRIYSPSLHLFNNKRADMEVCIYHKQIGGLPEKLLICVPFMKSTGILTSMTESSKMISNIFSSQGGCYNEPKLTSKPFTLNTILPSKPYFYYKNEKNEHVVCFHTTSENIIPANVDLSILNRDIQSYTNNSQQSVPLFFSGEQLSENVQDDIYIEFKTNVVEDTEGVEDTEDTEGFTTMKQLNNLATIKNIIGGLLLGGIVFSGYKIVTSDKKKL
jgi:hypothetical protein